MAERKRSKDGVQETEFYTDGTPAPGQSGRSQGELERRVGTLDEQKQATRGGGATRVHKSDEEGEGALGGHHGTGGPDGRHRDASGPFERDMPKTLSHDTWVLVADGEKALFLRNKADAETPHLVVVEKDEQQNPASREQGTHKPGRAGDTGTGQRSALDDTDWHRLAKERFAADLAARLYTHAHAGDFRRIVLVAAPRILGGLRDDLHPEVRARIVAEIDANLTNEPVDRIEAHVAQALAAA